MDRTAVASVVIGLGVTIAAMVFPTKYPQAPRPIINGIWWFGIALMLLGASYLVTEHPLNDLVEVGANVGLWLFNTARVIQRLPGFWLLVAFLLGVAANKWLIPYFKNHRVREINYESIGEWYSPREALQRFADPLLLERHAQAESQLAELHEKDGAKRGLAEYLVKCTETDAISDLQQKLTSGSLIAKGFPVKNGKTQAFEKKIDPHFWKLTFVGLPLAINFETGEAHNLLGHYSNVTIAQVPDKLPDR
jgi:hypothetical protein